MERTIQQESHSMLLFICLDRLGAHTQGGLSQYFNEDELDDIHKLYWFLRDSVQDIARTEATALRLSRAEAAKTKEGE